MVAGELPPVRRRLERARDPALRANRLLGGRSSDTPLRAGGRARVRPDGAHGVKVQPITDEQAAAIAKWRYEFPYEWYDTSADPRRIELFANPARRTHLRAVVDDGGELVGFFNFVPEGHEVRLGLGMRPDLTGRGLAQPFIEAGLAYGRRGGQPGPLPPLGAGREGAGPPPYPPPRLSRGGARA